jgi:hypothetical protein
MAVFFARVDFLPVKSMREARATQVRETTMLKVLDRVKP